MAEMKIAIEGLTPTNGTMPISGSVTLAGGSTPAFTSLTNATTGTGLTADFGAPQANITTEVIVTGTVTTGVVTLDTSQDGTNWVPNGNLTPISNTNGMISVSNEAWRYGRARISTNIAGGATVTCTLMAR